MTDQSSTHYTRYNTIHNNTRAGALIDTIPEDDAQLKTHPSIVLQESLLYDLLEKLRAENPDNYCGEIYNKILVPVPIRSNYISAALYKAHTPVDNRTRYALQLILLRYMNTYGRDFKRFTLREFSYALNEREFRYEGNKATIRLLPRAFLESDDVTVASKIGLPIGDWMINTAVEEPVSLDGNIIKVGLLMRQYIDHRRQLWRSVLQEGWDSFRQHRTVRYALPRAAQLLIRQVYCDWVAL